jgi:hypothetical protein
MARRLPGEGAPSSDSESAEPHRRMVTVQEHSVDEASAFMHHGTRSEALSVQRGTLARSW